MDINPPTQPVGVFRCSKCSTDNLSRKEVRITQDGLVLCLATCAKEVDAEAQKSYIDEHRTEWNKYQREYYHRRKKGQ